MQKNQIYIDREFFNHITNDGAHHPIYTHVHGRKNNKVIHYRWTYLFGQFTMHMTVFIDKIKQKYENIEGSSDKEIIDNAHQIWKEGLQNGK